MTKSRNGTAQKAEQTTPNLNYRIVARRKMFVFVFLTLIVSGTEVSTAKAASNCPLLLTSEFFGPMHSYLTPMLASKGYLPSYVDSDEAYGKLHSTKLLLFPILNIKLRPWFLGGKVSLRVTLCRTNTFPTAPVFRNEQEREGLKFNLTISPTIECRTIDSI
jgi:hypothetical protein